MVVSYHSCDWGKTNNLHSDQKKMRGEGLGVFPGLFQPKKNINN